MNDSYQVRSQQVQQLLINNDNLKMWTRYQDPNTSQWHPWIKK